MKKNITYLSVLAIATILVFAACSSNEPNNSEKMLKFISNFETLKLPISSSEMEHGKIIENEFLDVLTDTAGGFSRNYPDGKLHFETEYYYVGKIPSENEDFNIIIVAELPTVARFGLMSGALHEYKLYTISLEGKIIESILLVSGIEGEEDWALSASINEKLEIETKNSTITNYKIEANGKITKISETSKEEQYTFQDFIKESYKPEKLEFNSKKTSLFDIGRMDEEQIKYTKQNYEINPEIYGVEKDDYAKPIVFEMPNYTALLIIFGNPEKNEAYLFTIDKNDKVITHQGMIYHNYFDTEMFYDGSVKINTIEGNKLQITSFQEEYKKNSDSESLSTNIYIETDVNGNLIETKKQAKEKEESPIIATISDFEIGNNASYTFTTEKGNKYCFKKTPETIKYEFVYQDGNRPEGFLDPDFENVKFKIWFHSKQSDDGTEYLIIDKIVKKERRTIIATFTDFERGDFVYFMFEDETGKEYSFNQMPDGISYEFLYQDAERPDGIANPDLIGKKFKIDYHSEDSDGGMGGVVIDYFYVDKIEMIK